MGAGGDSASDYDYAQVLLADGEGPQLRRRRLWPRRLRAGMPPKGEDSSSRYGATGIRSRCGSMEATASPSVYSAAQTPGRVHRVGSFEGTVNFEGVADLEGLGRWFILDSTGGSVP